MLREHMNIDIKFSIAGLVLILLTIIFALIVGLEEGLPAVIIIVPAALGFVSFLLATHYSKPFRELLSDVDDIEEDESAKQSRMARARNWNEYLYIILSAIGTILLFAYLERHYTHTLSEGRATALTLCLCFFLFGLIHITAANFISALYNLGYRSFPYNYISLNTPKRSRLLGIILLLIAGILALGALL
jgi:hypothetical protein